MGDRERLFEFLPHWKKICRRDGHDYNDKQARYALGLFFLGIGDARKVPLESGKIRIEPSDDFLRGLEEENEELPEGAEHAKSIGEIARLRDKLKRRGEK